MLSTSNAAPQKRKYHFVWKDYDQKLIDKGDISFYLDILDHMESELELSNTKKRGRKFTYPNCLFVFCAIIRHLFQFSFRQLSGFIRFLSKHYTIILTYLTIPPFKQKRIYSIDLEDYLPARIRFFWQGDINCARFKRIETVSIWRLAQSKQSMVSNQSKTRKGWIKIHFAVEVKTHCVVAVEITDDQIRLEILPKRFIWFQKRKQKKCNKVVETFGDGGWIWY